MAGFNSRDRDRRELQARLLRFRSEHTDAEIETELVVAEEDMAVCRATLRTGSSGSASSHGIAFRASSGEEYVEVAEDRALARALTSVGYGAISGDESDEDDAAYSPPIDLISARSLLRDESEAQEIESEGSSPPPQSIRQTRQEADPPKDESEEPGDGADVSWNKFWSWARPRGYTTAKDLNELLGVDNVLAYTPREVRQMLVKYEMDNPPGGQDE